MPSGSVPVFTNQHIVFSICGIALIFRSRRIHPSPPCSPTEPAQHCAEDVILQPCIDHSRTSTTKPGRLRRPVCILRVKHPEGGPMKVLIIVRDIIGRYMALIRNRLQAHMGWESADVLTRRIDRSRFLALAGSKWIASQGAGFDLGYANRSG